MTNAAEKLHTSQPGVSKQIKLLESELEANLLVRRRNRTNELSPIGQAVLPLARRILKDTETLKQIVNDHADPSKGEIVIATTHVHASYTLVPVLQRFRQMHPRVRVHLILGRPEEMPYWVSNGDVDVAIGTAVSGSIPSLMTVPCFRLAHSVVAPVRHPLLKSGRPSLEEIASYPLISTGVKSRLTILLIERCASYGLQPNIVMHALDIETVKKYVRAGLGIAVIPTIAVDPAMERGIRALDASHVFEPAIAAIITQDDLTTRDYVRNFVDLVAPRRKGNSRIQQMP